MQNSYSLFSEINYWHDYFSDGRLRSLRTTPVRATATELLRFGLLFKPHATGFRLLFDEWHAGNQRARADVSALGLQLYFTLECDEPYFLSQTAGLEDFQPGRSFFHFTNRRSFDGGRLHRGAFADGASLADNVATRSFTGLQRLPFGLLSIHLAAAQPEMSVHFSARTTHWRYFLVSDHVRGLEAPAIRAKNEEVVFEGPEEVELPDKRSALRFVSPVAIALKEMPARSYQLLENYGSEKGRQKVAVAALPTPTLRSLSRTEPNAAGARLYNYSDIFI